MYDKIKIAFLNFGALFLLPNVFGCRWKPSEIVFELLRRYLENREHALFI